MATKRNAAKKKDSDVEQVTIPPIETQRAKIKVRGITPLLCHRFSERAIEAIEAKQQQKASHRKAARDPEQEFQDSLYRVPGKKGYFFPARAFRLAAIDACRYADGLHMTYVSGAFQILEDYVHLKGSEPRMRKDTGRLQKKTGTIIYRAEFKKWETEFTVRYNARAISISELLNLFNIAGFAVGVGNWRPQKVNSIGGSFGQFEVVSA